MTAANVRNNHTGPLNVGGVDILPGKTVRIEDWDVVKNSNAVKIWIGADILDVTAEAPTEPEDNKKLPPLPGLPGLGGSDDDAAKDAIIAELRDDYGIEKTRRTSLENLQKELDEAKAAK